MFGFRTADALTGMRGGVSLNATEYVSPNQSTSIEALNSGGIGGMSIPKNVALSLSSDWSIGLQCADHVFPLDKYS
jgi:hypothetical protein